MGTSTKLHMVYDPGLGAISAVVDRDGTILSTGAAVQLQAPNLEVARLAEHDIAELMLAGQPWIDPEVWERCVHRGWVDGSDDVHV